MAKAKMVQKRHTAPAELWRWVERLARKQDRSSSSIVRDALNLYRDTLNQGEGT